jgi:hypothetical protein
VRRALAIALLGAALGAPPAAAEEVTRGELRRLAQRAATSPAALEQLRRVDSVDGRPVDVEAALRGATGEEAAARAEVLAESLTPVSQDTSARARGRAQEILRGRRYTGTDLPRPFQRPLRWLGDRLRPIGEWISDSLSAIGRAIPGGPVVFWTLLGLVVVALGALIGRQAARRSVAAAGSAAPAASGAPAETPRRLERAAEAAERDGRWEEALRLRFRAGLLRLDERQLLEYRPSLTTGEAAEILRLEAFDRLGARFDAVAYGGQPAAEADAQDARRDWTDVLESAGRR